MRHNALGRALLLGCLIAFATGCDRAPEAQKGGQVRAAESRPAADAQDPNAENPDRDRWVDLATVPFRPERVGGRVVQTRGQIVPSLNAVLRVGRSADVERIHKYLLGAPLLMELPDKGPNGFEFRPHAAASLPEDSPDHLSQVWTLRPDLTWEDGRPVTSRDYVFTLDLMRKPEVDSSISDAYRLIESVEAIDDRRFRVRWSRPTYRAVYSVGLDLHVVPAHAVPSDPASFNKVTSHLACGPYRIATYEPATKIELVLRDEYKKAAFPIRPHYVERFVWQGGIRDPVAQKTKLLNGDAHIVGMTPDHYATWGVEPSFQRAAWRSHFTMPVFGFIGWNLKDPADRTKPHPVLADVRVRRALSHLIPLETVADTTYQGLARPVSGPFDFRDPGYDPAVPHFAFDPAKASALLDEAGWKPGSSGVREKDGARCRIALARANKDVFPSICQTLQDEARKVGIEIAIEDRPGLYSEDLPARRFDAVIVLWVVDAIEPDVSAQFHSRHAASGGANYAGLADAEVDGLLDRMEVSFDAKERAALRRTLHARLHELVPWTFLLANATTVGVSRQLANVKVHDLGIRFHDLVLRDRWN